MAVARASLDSGLRDLSETTEDVSDVVRRLEWTVGFAPEPTEEENTVQASSGGGAPANAPAPTASPTPTIPIAKPRMLIPGRGVPGGAAFDRSRQEIRGTARNGALPSGTVCLLKDFRRSREMPVAGRACGELRLR